MCKMLYLAADQPAPLISWQPNNPGFWVRELQETETCVRKQFTKTYAYYVGSHEKCGCGFAYGIRPTDPNSPLDEEERVEEEAGKESVRQLAEYLALVAADRAVELYACWDGEQGCEPVERAVITPTALGGPAFQFSDSQFLIVQGLASSSPT
jgi:hypothetical protein